MSKININTEFYDGKDILCCPKCKFEYNHIIESGIIKPQDLDEDKFSKPYSFLPMNSRGSTVYTIFRCENSHYWYITFGFHKGHTDVESEVIENGDIFGHRELDRT